MPNSITYGFTDAAGKKSYHGFTIADTTKTPANVATFAAAIAVYSAGGNISNATKITVDVSAPTVSGTVANSRRGVVILKNTADGRRFPVTIPSIEDEHVVSAPNAPSSLTPACCAAIKTAFETLTGLTTSLVGSYVDGSQFQR